MTSPTRHLKQEEGRGRAGPPRQLRRAASVRPTVGVVGAGEADTPWSGQSRRGTFVTSPTRHLKQ